MVGASLIAIDFGGEGEAFKSRGNQVGRVNTSRPHLRAQLALLDNLAFAIEEINQEWANRAEEANGGRPLAKAPAKLSYSDVTRLNSFCDRLDVKYRPRPGFRLGMSGDIAHANVMEAMEAVMANLDTTGIPREQDVITARRRNNDNEVDAAAA
jgi:hypothetical protein